MTCGLLRANVSFTCSLIPSFEASRPALHSRSTLEAAPIGATQLQVQPAGFAAGTMQHAVQPGGIPRRTGTGLERGADSGILHMPAVPMQM